ncbi:MAG: branched-chain amino acid ABC transporter substrate-binding protein [Desulfobulbaceae bacterium]|nr:MAG: branched-chain amino acid ABC transporter substrate-binding protein [Desulfobulbaceae bacterium]
MKNMLKNSVLAMGLMVCAALVLTFVSGCSRTEEKEAPKETIKVGAILAETGGASFLGGPEARTIRMMVEKINAEGGINGQQIELIIKDSAANPDKAISFAKQLIEEEQVLAILGPSTSGESMKIKSICEKAETIMLSCAAAEVIVNPVAKWVFKTPQTDSFAAQKIFMEMNNLGISKIAILAGNTGFGKAGREQLKQYAPQFNIDIVEDEVYDKSSTDLSAVVTKIKANEDVQAVVNWSIVPAQAIVAKNMRQAGWDVPLFQSHGFGNIKYVEAAGEAAEGIIFPCGRLLAAEMLADDHPQKSVLTGYINAYETKYDGEKASTFGGHGYDAIMILAKAIENAGSTDKYKVRDAIENLQGFAGTGGVFNFSATDHNGLGIDAFEMMTVQDGKFVLYNK